MENFNIEELKTKVQRIIKGEEKLSGLHFGLLYLAPMLITYVLRPMFLSSSFSENGTGEMPTGLISVILIICYGAMIGLTYLRGISTEKNYITVLPLIGGLFDLFLVYIPFVPSITNIAVYILALPDSENEAKKATKAEATPKTVAKPKATTKPKTKAAAKPKATKNNVE